MRADHWVSNSGCVLVSPCVGSSLKQVNSVGQSSWVHHAPDIFGEQVRGEIEASRAFWFSALTSRTFCFLHVSYLKQGNSACQAPIAHHAPRLFRMLVHSWIWASSACCKPVFIKYFFSKPLDSFLHDIVFKLLTFGTLCFSLVCKFCLWSR